MGCCGLRAGESPAEGTQGAHSQAHSGDASVGEAPAVRRRHPHCNGHGPVDRRLPRVEVARRRAQQLLAEPRVEDEHGAHREGGVRLHLRLRDLFRHEGHARRVEREPLDVALEGRLLEELDERLLVHVAVELIPVNEARADRRLERLVVAED